MVAEIYNNNLNNTEKAQEYYQKIIFDHSSSIYLVEARKKYRKLRGDKVQQNTYTQINNYPNFMYIYNVTINIDETVHKEWLTWMESHIPNVLNTGKFISAKLTEVLVDEEMGGKTYSVQYTATTREELDDYYKEDAEKLQVESLKKFGDKMLAFRTELRLIKEFYPTNVSN